MISLIKSYIVQGIGSGALRGIVYTIVRTALKRVFFVGVFLIVAGCSESAVVPLELDTQGSSSTQGSMTSDFLSSMAGMSSSSEREGAVSTADVQSSGSFISSSTLDHSSQDGEGFSFAQISSVAEVVTSPFDIDFSTIRGHVTQSFSLKLETKFLGDIYVTTNGLEPTPTLGELYTEALEISKSTVVKAAVYTTTGRISDIIAHTYIFTDQVVTQDGSNLPPYAEWGHSGPDWEMDPTVISEVGATTVAQSLRALPTISLSLNWEDWFGPLGIYIAGEGIERETTVEYIETDGTSIQSRSAVEIFGGSSVDRWKTNKLSMKLTFRDAHGDGKFDYPLFKDSPVESFDRIILDAILNLSFNHPDLAQRSKAQFVHDQFVADLHNTLGGHSPHGTYAHLYLNGIYWGLYYIHERPDHSFAESYYGGDKDTYDVIKHTPETVAHGTAVAFASMLALTEEDLSLDVHYDALEAVLDIEDYIAYMLTNIYAGNSDWHRHNWYASKAPTGKWYFHSWDAEHVLKDLNYNNTSALFTGSIGLFEKLQANVRFNQKVQAFVDREFYGTGVFTPARAAELYSDRLNEVEEGVHAESARWGDVQSPGDPHTKANTWDLEKEHLLSEYFPQRTAVVLAQLRSAGVIQ